MRAVSGDARRARGQDRGRRTADRAHAALGEALAAEWRHQGEKIDPATLPLRDMADYAIDIAAADPAAIAQGLVAYAETDTLCYRADPDEPLSCAPARGVGALARRVRDRAWHHAGAGQRRAPPPAAARSAVGAARKLLALDPFALAGVEAMTKLAASLVTALAALDAAQEEEPLALWQAVCLEEEWQADLWGRDWEAEERRQRREADFLRACAFARLARG
jgi:chaperone required for assembly of F1-ATPase